MTDVAWDPETYAARMAEEIVDYEGLQAALLAAAGEAVGATPPGRVLDLGTGTGETARRVLGRFPTAELTGIDASEDMLAAARTSLAGYRTSLLVRRLQDPLPGGPYDLAVSALAVHHLDGSAKSDLFRRVHQVLEPGGAFVLADLVVPECAEDAHTEIDGVHDMPSGVDEQVAWLLAAGFRVSVPWRHRDLAVLAATA